jgi:hypothetical protein
VSAFPSTSWTIMCDRLGCFEFIGPAEDTTRAALRKRAAKKGWTTAVGQAERYSIRSWTDFCPAHKSEAAATMAEGKD